MAKFTVRFIDSKDIEHVTVLEAENAVDAMKIVMNRKECLGIVNTTRTTPEVVEAPIKRKRK